VRVSRYSTSIVGDVSDADSDDRRHSTTVLLLYRSASVSLCILSPPPRGAHHPFSRDAKGA
jgi:hypothetical protein